MYHALCFVVISFKIYSWLVFESTLSWLLIINPLPRVTLYGCSVIARNPAGRSYPDSAKVPGLHLSPFMGWLLS
jgi:hypothetical protein